MLEGKLSDDEIVTLADAYFDKNVAHARNMGTIDTPAITIDRTTGIVTIDVAAKVAMTVSRVGGFKEMAVPVTSTAVYKQRDIEVGMALDITGSMADRINGTRKIDALKSAFELFADRVIPDRQDAGHRARIGLAPYSAGINLGSYAGPASNYRSKDGCVTERKSGTSTDATDPFYVKADGSKDIDPTEGASTYTCPVSVLNPLSDDKDALIKAVDQYQPDGFTGGHFGAQWAWNLISDKWDGVWGGDSQPDSYEEVQEGKLLKAVVLMTDGIFNTAYHGGKSSQQAIALCNAMKQKGVVVFAVGFGLGSDPTAINTLQTCATQGAGYFANASNQEELEAAFSQFAGKLSELRISK